MANDPRDDFDKFFRKMMEEFGREIGRSSIRDFDISNFEGKSGVQGFHLEIRDDGTGEPEIKFKKIGQPGEEIEPIVAGPPQVGESLEIRARPSEVKPVKRTLETNAAKIQKLDEVVLTMQVPGVKEKDVEVRRLGNSLEVIARKPSGEAYFATFELPQDADPGERKVEIKDKMLMIAVPRHHPSQTRD